MWHAIKCTDVTERGITGGATCQMKHGCEANSS